MSAPVTEHAPPPPKPASWLDDPDDWRWENDALELTHTALGQTRKTATAWTATISTLLGVFSLVAFVKGPTTFTDLSSDWAAALAAALIVASAVLAGVAIFLGALAAQGTPNKAARIDGWTLKLYYADQARKARLELAWSRVLAVLAALGVVAGVAVTWFDTLATPAPASKPPSAIVTVGGSVQCGTLSTATDGSVLFAVGKTKPVPLGALKPTSVVPVGSCPPKS